MLDVSPAACLDRTSLRFKICSPRTVHTQTLVVAVGLPSYRDGDTAHRDSAGSGRQIVVCLFGSPLPLTVTDGLNPLKQYMTPTSRAGTAMDLN